MTFNDPEPKPEEAPAEVHDSFADAFAARAAGEEVETEAKPSEEEGKTADAEPASVAATEQVAAKDGSNFDPFAGMNPEQKAHWEKIQHSDQSQRGRVAALTRKMQNGTAQPAPSPAAQTATNAGTGKANESDDLDAKMNAAAEEYPDAVGPFVEIINAMKSQIADLSTKVQPITDDRSEAELTSAYQTLEAAHPDFRQIAADPSWNAWIEDQPEAIQTLANSYDPSHVAKTIDLFKLERKQATAPAVDTATEEKRKRQLEGQKDVSSKGVPAASGVPNDFEAAFKARAKAIMA
jgi:hypothetical protein